VDQLRVRDKSTVYDLEAIRLKYRLTRLLITVIGSIITIASLSIPLAALQPLLRALNEATTNNVSNNTLVGASVGVVTALTITVAFAYTLLRRQRRELVRTRNRISQLEAMAEGATNPLEVFARSVERLDDPAVMARLGAIHTLGRLAARSDADALAVRDVLTAYVRQHAQPLYHRETPPKQREDIQAAVTTLLRSDVRAVDGIGLNLEGLDLSGLSLKGADLDGANLLQTDLSNSDLSLASLNGANLKRANLSNANLLRASLVDAILEEANLSEANLAAADLSRSLLLGASMRKAFLGEARLNETLFGETDLRDADLTNADLRHAFLTRTRMDRASLLGARLDSAVLRDVNLTEAVLEDPGALRLADVDRETLASVPKMQFRPALKDLSSEHSQDD
jgi:uncharacterized protein YjbI with pentapeptide repeats